MGIVIKRNGAVIKFDAIKIRASINSARSAVECTDLFLVETVLQCVLAQCHDSITTAEIHEIIKRELVEYGCPDVAQAYDVYKHNHNIN